MYNLLLLIKYFSNVLEDQLWFKTINSTAKQQVINQIAGPKQRHENYLLTGLTVFYSTIMCAGVPANLLTMWVIRKNSDLHSPSNAFIFNLAVNDLINLAVGKCIIYNCT